KAANPLSVAWGECQSLLTMLDTSPDPQDTRLRLRSALRRIVDSIWLLIIPLAGGRDRLAAVQIWFTGGKRHRDYLIWNRPARGNLQVHILGQWWVKSFADLAAPDDFDLRKRGQARELEKWLGNLNAQQWEKLLAALEKRTKAE